MYGRSGASLQSAEVLALKPCAHCSRSFAQNILAKHETICERGLRRRQIFNSSRQRLEAMRSLQQASPPAGKRSPIAERPAAPPKVPNATLTAKSPPPKRNLAPAALAASAAPAAPAAAASKSTSPKSAAVSAPSSGKRTARDAPTGGRNTLERCPYCERSFGLRAIEKHVVYCMEKSVAAAYAVPLYSEETLSAKKRMEARMKYRPPKPNAKHPKH